MNWMIIVGIICGISGFACLFVDLGAALLTIAVGSVLLFFGIKKKKRSKEQGEPAKPANVSAASKTEIRVYITKTGKKFHYDRECQALQNAWSRGEVYQTPLSGARSGGRTACDRCCYDYLHE